MKQYESDLQSFVVKAGTLLIQQSFDTGNLSMALNVQARIIQELRQMIVTMERKVWQEELPNLTYEYPKTWWDAVKLGLFPKWLLKRFPATMNVLHVSMHICYPRLNPNVPEQEHVFKMYVKTMTTFKN